MVDLVRTQRWSAAFGITLFAIACSSSNGESGGQGGAAQGAGGNGTGGAAGQSASSSSSSSASSTSGVSASASVGAGGFGGGPMQFVCDPPAAPGSLYEISAPSYDLADLDPVSMCKYRGKVALVVNTAAA
jgi:hypothetical protein